MLRLTSPSHMRTLYSTMFKQYAQLILVLLGLTGLCFTIGAETN